jgi:hypothetical protein
MNAAASIFGGISNAKSYKKIINNLNEQKEENQDWYDQRYNEDSTQRADAQALLTQTEESIRNRNKQAAGAAAVMGGTEESVAAAKAANNTALTDAVSQINAQASNRKDQIEQQYQANKANLNSQINNMQEKKAQSTAEAIKGASDAAGNIAKLGF